ncbi:MAG: hypothetical protein ABR606_11480 [Vicinamibacterales bacterium]
MFGERTLAVAARIERIETYVAQLRADLQRLDRKLDMHVEALRSEIREAADRAGARGRDGGDG